MNPTPRAFTEEREQRDLQPWAAHSAQSAGRQRPEADTDSVRTAFQRDRDRIIHAKAFRRLKDKTQVFIAAEGDHYRTRLTHTLEVAQIARTLARALRLNEDLTEAIALAHDIGHTPFGHAGERVLDELVPGGFRHYEQSLRVCDMLERPGGLNLTQEVRDGIVSHTASGRPGTLEARVVHLADRIAYVNHDIDDALRAQIIQADELPKGPIRLLGNRHSQRIHHLVLAVISESEGQDKAAMRPEEAQALEELRQFLFQRVYFGSPPKVEEKKAEGILRQLYLHYRENPELLPAQSAPGEEGVRDYCAGMTDHFAISQYARFFLPRPWPPEE
ncbi:MAG: deoxyguanosinetriphosphate triphosphohydrolase [Thermaerobacter sp.]|nr:deoxyguanosinetriphosphate triphosphohydrolase [Thermaerobacter sp.]